MRDRALGDGPVRGQSEVIGFILVFTTVLAATLAVGVFGLAALEDVRESTVANNGEVAMRTVGSDLESIFYGSAETRTTELTLDAATLAVADPTHIEVSVESTDASTSIDTDETWELDPLVYRSDDSAIHYENSLVLRQERAGSVAVTDSLFRMNDRQAVIPVVRTNTSAVASVRGGTRRITAYENGTGSLVRTSESLPAGDTLEISVTVSDISGREGAWARTLNDAYTGPASQPCRPDLTNDRVSCTFETDRVAVSVVTVQYSIR
jgi:hypothetical protein